MSAGSQALNSLLKRTTIEDHEEVLKACNATLKQSKGDVDTQHIKVVALLKLDRFDDAVHVLEEGGDKLKQRAQLEHAYALYKLGKLGEARDLATRVTNERGARHVEAQASYRSEDFAHAAELYKSLSESRQAAIENEENDLRINASATDAQLEWNRQGHLVHKKKAGREDLEAFETAYNAACGCIARGELGQGEILLKRAKDLCSSSIDLSEQEKNAELLPISVQQLYVFSASGKADLAEALASEIVLNDIPDLSTRHIAQINRLATTPNPANPYLAHRIMHSATPLPDTDKFFHFQEALQRQDKLSLDLLSSKFSGVVDSTGRHLSKNPSPTTSAAINNVSVTNAAAHAQNQLGKFGLKSILPLLEKRPTDVGLLATIVHLYILTNNHGSAITVMETFLKRLDESTADSDLDVRFAPGLVAILVSLYAIQGRKSHIKTELLKAASYWRRKSKQPAGLMHAAGLSLLESSKEEDLSTAGDVFGSLLEADSTDRFATAGYVAAYATSEPSKVESLVDKLNTVDRLTIGIDALELDRAGVPQLAVHSTAVTSKKRAAADDSKPAKKRVRKSRLPKDHDPSKAPDPERWLPLRDRSSYRPKGKKGKQKAAALTQGGVNEKSAEALNVSAAGGAAKSSNPVISGPSKPKKKKPKK